MEANHRGPGLNNGLLLVAKKCKPCEIYRKCVMSIEKYVLV